MSEILFTMEAAAQALVPLESLGITVDGEVAEVLEDFAATTSDILFKASEEAMLSGVEDWRSLRDSAYALRAARNASQG